MPGQISFDDFLYLLECIKWKISGAIQNVLVNDLKLFLMKVEVYKYMLLLVETIFVERIRNSEACVPKYKARDT